jgi:hypothetical protein
MEFFLACRLGRDALDGELTRHQKSLQDVAATRRPCFAHITEKKYSAELGNACAIEKITCVQSLNTEEIEHGKLLAPFWSGTRLPLVRR